MHVLPPLPASTHWCRRFRAGALALPAATAARADDD